jgi:tRNA1(Val) A37 N6-methylase TrmN6
MAGLLRHRGTISLILPAASLPEAAGAIREAGCALSCVFPLWPKANRPAKLMILRAVKGGRMGCVLRPGLVLHAADGSFTPPTRAVLWDGAPLYQAPEPSTLG